MNSLQIQYFLTTAEQESFTEAARILYVSQPAVSKQIRLLEQELGVMLFERSGKTVHLTYSGQAYYDYFIQCRFQRELLGNRLAQQEKSGQLPLRISYLEGLDPIHFLSYMDKAAARSLIPLKLSLSSYALPQLIQALHAGQADAILTFGSPLTRELCRTLPVYDVPRIVLYSADKFPDGIQQISQLSHEIFFLPEDEYTPFLEQTLYRIFLDLGFTPQVEYAPNFATIIDRVERGEGVFIYNRWCRQCRLSSFGTVELPSVQTFYLVCKSQDTRPELLQFAEEFQRLLRAV